MNSKKKKSDFSWKYSPRFIVRMSGFPNELIADLRLKKTYALMLRHLNTDARAQFLTEIEEKLNRLLNIATTKRFREALMLSNPANSEVISNWVDTPKSDNIKKTISHSITLVMYLQRFCMKNDTASFFGPIYWGSFHIDQSSNIIILLPNNMIETKRKVFYSHWAGQLISNWISSFPGIDTIVVPRRTPSKVLQKNYIYGFDPQTDQWQQINEYKELRNSAHEIYSLIDGKTTLREIYTKTKLDFGLSVEEQKVAIEELVAAGLIVTNIELPFGIIDPIDYLYKLLDGLSLEKVQSLLRIMIKERGDLETENRLHVRRKLIDKIHNTFSDVVNSNPTRGSGRHYADRGVIFEDALANFEKFSIGAHLLNDIEKLAPVWDLFCIQSEWEFYFVQEIMKDWARKRFPKQKKVGFLEYVSAFLTDQSVLQPLLLDASNKSRVIISDVFHKILASADIREGVVHLTFDQLNQIINNYRVLEKRGAIVNPDLIIVSTSLDAVNNGDYKIVLGEVHGSIDLITHTPATQFLSSDERKNLEDLISIFYKTVARKDEAIAHLIGTHVHKTHCYISSFSIDVEGQDRSPKARDSVCQLSELETHFDDKEVRLYAPKIGKYLLLDTMLLPNLGNKDFNPLRPFSLPEINGGLKMPLGVEYIPRVQIERFVLSRQSWKIDFQDWKYQPLRPSNGWDYDLFSHMLKMKEFYKMPNDVYVRILGEPKPIYISFDNYFLLYAFIKKWSARKTTAYFIEAYPSPQNAWLQDKKGHYFFEVRTGAYRGIIPDD